MLPNRMSNRVLLSRYFDENTYLVAGMCWKCYSECIDVKITGTNCRFLNQAKSYPYSKGISDYKDVLFELDDPLCNNHASSEVCRETKAIIELSLEKKRGNVEDDDYKAPIDLLFDSSNFCGFTLSQYNDCTTLNEMNKIILKIENCLTKASKPSNIVKNVKDIQSDLNECKEKLKFVGFNTKEFDENIRAINRINQIIKKTEHNIHQILLRRNTCFPKKEEQFFGFKQADYEASYIIVSKLNALVRRLKTWSRKIPELEHSQNIKSELFDDKSETFSKFFPIRNKSYHELNFKKDIKIKIEDLDEKNYILSQPIWHPPKSPHHLIEEDLYHDPWALLVATIFLNRTRAKRARDYINIFLQDYATPFAVLKTEPSNLEKYFENIGLKVVRSVQVWRMSYDFVCKDWIDVKDLYGVGKYGRDAFNMFCLGNLDVEPKDRYLKIYKAWYDRVHLKKDDDFDQKFFDAKRCKQDEWLSDESDSGNSDVS